MSAGRARRSCDSYATAVMFTSILELELVTSDGSYKAIATHAQMIAIKAMQQMARKARVLKHCASRSFCVGTRCQPRLRMSSAMRASSAASSSRSQNSDSDAVGPLASEDALLFMRMHVAVRALE